LDLEGGGEDPFGCLEILESDMNFFGENFGACRPDGRNGRVDKKARNEMFIEK